MKKLTATVDGVRVETHEVGDGSPIFFLGECGALFPEAPFLEKLAACGRVIAPSHPGFGMSDRPSDIRRVGDIAWFHLSLLYDLRLPRGLLVGTSFGGWVAAEVALLAPSRFTHLVLISPFGIRVGDRTTRDIADIYAMSRADLIGHAFADPDLGQVDYSLLTDDERLGVARSREAMAYYGWRPYMHDPGLRRRLKQIRVPTLVISGEADRVTGADYTFEFAQSIPGASYVRIPKAGHYSHLEQPDVILQAIRAFTDK